MTVRSAAGDGGPTGAECWCCGSIEDPGRLVQLGNHPEVGVCIRCAHSLSKWAREIDDQGRAGLAVRARTRARDVRTWVVRHGWHQHRIVGRGLRWLGRWTP